MTPLDQSISDFAVVEGKLNADTSNLSVIQANIAAATSPLPGAQDLVKSDTLAYNNSLDTLIAAATAAKIPVA